MAGNPAFKSGAFRKLAIFSGVLAWCLMGSSGHGLADQPVNVESDFRTVGRFADNTPAKWLDDLQPSPYAQIKFSPDGKYAVKTGNLRIEFASVTDKTLLWTCPTDGTTVWSMSWSSDGKKMAVSDEKGVFFLEAPSGKLLGAYPGLKGRVLGLEWSPDGKYIAAIGPKTGAPESQRRDSLIVWDPMSQNTILEVSEFPGTRVHWSPDSTRIAFNGRDHRVQIWNVVDKKKLANISVPERGLPPFVWSPDGKYIVIGDMMVGEATIYDSADGAVITVHKFKALEDLEWSADGKSILSIFGNGQDRWMLPLKSGNIEKTEIKAKVLGEEGYIPKNIDECYAQLDARLKPADKKAIKECSEEELSKYHMGLGLFIRNSWGLWGDSELRQYFIQKGIRHPDDISGVIIEMYWRKMNGRTVDLDAVLDEKKSELKRTLMHLKALPPPKPPEKDSGDKIQHRMMPVQSKQPAKDQMLEITKRMIGVQLVKPPSIPTLAIPAVIGEKLRTRYATSFEGKQIITAKKYGKGDDFTTPPYVVDLMKQEIHPVEIPELDTIEDAVVCGAALYVNGKKSGRRLIVECRSGKHTIINPPPDNGWLCLGISKAGVLALQQSAIFLHNNGTWKKIISTTFHLPKSGIPAEQIGQRIYFRDEGVYEDNKRMSWVDLTSPDKLHYFDSDCGLVTPSGPRWEFVSSFTADPQGRLWISAGMDSHTLLVWSKSEGYKIATMNNRLTFDGMHLVGPSEMSGITLKDIAITCVLPEDNNRILCFGPSGLYRLDGKTLTQILVFSNGVQDNPEGKQIYHTTWIPTHIVKLGDDDYLIGAHWGGTIRLQKGADEFFHFTLLDREIGRPSKLR